MGFRNLDLRAMDFAAKAHSDAGQIRKYTGEPYIMHPIAVAGIVRSVPHTEEMIAAALLHDVVEDTPITHEEIEAEFGPVVSKMVRGLTNVNKDEGNRARRKSLDRVRLAGVSPEVKTIKLADLIHNSVSIIKHDPKFAPVFIEEMDSLLNVLAEGDSTLLERALTIVNDFRARRTA